MFKGETLDTWDWDDGGEYLICQHQGVAEPFDMTRDFGSLNHYQYMSFMNPNNDGSDTGDNNSNIYNAPIIPGLTGADENVMGDAESLNSWENCDKILKDKIFLGYLDFKQSTTTNGLQPGGEIAEDVIINEFFRFDRELWEGTFNNMNTTMFNNEVFPFSLLDGESGPGGHL